MESIKLSRKDLINWCEDNTKCIWLDCNIYEGQNQVEYTALCLYCNSMYLSSKNEGDKQYFKKQFEEYYKLLNDNIKIYLKNNSEIKGMNSYHKQVFYSCGVYGNTGQVHSLVMCFI